MALNPSSPNLASVLQLAEFLENSDQFFPDCHAKLDEALTLNFDGMTPFKLVCRPENVRQIFQNLDGTF